MNVLNFIDVYKRQPFMPVMAELMKQSAATFIPGIKGGLIVIAADDPSMQDVYKRQIHSRIIIPKQVKQV